jgi:anti-sigma B factor antagonist
MPSSRHPSRAPFKLVEEEISPEACEIRVEGELDLAVADQLVESISCRSALLVLIDLGGCAFIDSTGIAVVVRADRERSKRGGRVVVHSPSGQVLRVLTVTGLVEHGVVFSDRTAALAVGGTDDSGQLTR